MRTETAKCANAIKELLKKKYPTIKFSVKSKNYANGNNVTVNWNLGPTTEKIDSIINQYQYGDFDPMIDLYEYSNKKRNIPQAKFVFCERDHLTEKEILNNGLKYNDPKRRNLYKEGKTLFHIIGRDLCREMDIEFVDLETTIPPKKYQHMISGYNFDAGLEKLVYQLLAKTDFMTGYHGIKHELTKDGAEISNSFILY